MKPIAIDLFCGLGGWTNGLLAEGWDVIGFDVERHAYGDHRYPAQLVLQDVRTIHGAQFRNASLIVASSPCQEFSYRAMPWKRAKALGPPLLGMDLFAQAARIQREAIEAAGRFIPMVQENVRGAQPFVGRARWHYGSFYLWGDVPALMPITFGRSVMKEGVARRTNGETNFQGSARRANGTEDLRGLRSEGAALPPMLRGGDVRLLGVPGSGSTIPDWPATGGFEHDDGVKVPSYSGRRTDVGNGNRFTSREGRADGVKCGGSAGDDWFAHHNRQEFGTHGVKTGRRLVQRSKVNESAVEFQIFRPKSRLSTYRDDPSATRSAHREGLLPGHGSAIRSSPMTPFPEAIVSANLDDEREVAA